MLDYTNRCVENDYGIHPVTLEKPDVKKSRYRQQLLGFVFPSDIMMIDLLFYYTKFDQQNWYQCEQLHLDCCWSLKVLGD